MSLTTLIDAIVRNERKNEQTRQAIKSLKAAIPKPTDFVLEVKVFDLIEELVLIHRFRHHGLGIVNDTECSVGMRGKAYRIATFYFETEADLTAARLML